MDYFTTRRAIRIGVLHFFLTMALVVFGYQLGDWGIWLGELFKQPLMATWFWLDQLGMPDAVQWPLILFNSLFWGYVIIIVWRLVYTRYQLWRYRKYQEKLARMQQGL